MILFSLGFICGVAFCIAWVFVEFGLECAKLAGRKWSWKHGFSKHAAYLELEELSKVRQWDHETLFNEKPDNKASPR